MTGCHSPVLLRSSMTRVPSGTGKFRDKNPNWRGGRSVASNGYVLVRVGVDHHLADVRGYAYEHRLVGEQKLGRRLAKGEHAHHINGNKADNRPENIEILTSHEPRVEHRKHANIDGYWREPGEDNTMVHCDCGCGGAFETFDASGRRRRFLPGHNMFYRQAR